jgi:hypothetical protein
MRYALADYAPPLARPRIWRLQNSRPTVRARSSDQGDGARPIWATGTSFRHEGSSDHRR